MEVATLNLMHRLNVSSPSPGMTNHPWKGHGWVTWNV